MYGQVSIYSETGMQHVQLYQSRLYAPPTRPAPCFQSLSLSCGLLCWQKHRLETIMVSLRVLLEEWLMVFVVYRKQVARLTT